MRTIDDIIPPSRRPEPEPIRNDSEPQMPLRTTQSPTFPYKTLLAVLIIIALSVGALYYFSSAKVDITPNTVSAAVQSSFTATQSSGDLPYEIITTQKVASQSVKSTGTKTVTSSASGPITIFNTQAKAQRLIANTRFATSDGLVFRIRDAVTIPAGTAANPGSITVTVTADKPGDSYNVAPTSFTIPGFAGTPQATQVYARSTTAMAGGASGTVPVIDPAEEAQAAKALQEALLPELTTALEAQVPEGYLLLPGSSSTSFEQLPTATSASGAEVKQQGTMTAVLFSNTALAKAVAISVAGLGYQGEPVSLLLASNLTLSSSSLPLPDATSYTFSLSGTASMVYVVDPTRIAAAVAGKTRSAAEVALTNYPEVKRAIIILRPFWRKTFPEDPSIISVKVATP